MSIKLKLHKKKLLYMGVLGLMLTMNNSKCLSEEKLYYGKEKYHTYKRDQIYLIFDMKSGNCQEYLLNIRVNNDNVLEEIYDLDNCVIKFSDIVSKEEHDIYLRHLKNSSNIVFLEDLEDYFSNTSIKEYYTLDEIKFLEPYIFNIIENKYLEKVLSK